MKKYKLDLGKGQYLIMNENIYKTIEESQTKIGYIDDLSITTSPLMYDGYHNVYELYPGIGEGKIEELTTSTRTEKTKINDGIGFGINKYEIKTILEYKDKKGFVYDQEILSHDILTRLGE